MFFRYKIMETFPWQAIISWPFFAVNRTLRFFQVFWRKKGLFFMVDNQVVLKNLCFLYAYWEIFRNFEADFLVKNGIFIQKNMPSYTKESGSAFIVCSQLTSINNSSMKQYRYCNYQLGHEYIPWAIVKKTVNWRL